MAPRVDAENKTAAFLLASLTLLTTLLGALGIASGAIGDMIRNHQLWSGAAFILTVIAIIFGAIALTYGPPDESEKQNRLLRKGCVVLAGGLICAVIAGVLTWGDRAQPSVSGVVSRGQEGFNLELRLQQSSLKAKDHVIVSVDPLVRSKEPGHLVLAGDSLYGASIGPNRSGEIDRTINISLPPRGFTDLGVKAWIGDEPGDCFRSRTNTTGCMTLEVPRLSEKPQLHAKWVKGSPTSEILIELTARNIAGSSVRLAAVGTTPRGKRRELSVSASRPRWTGHVLAHASVARASRN